jgi:hypothetical protein
MSTIHFTLIVALGSAIGAAIATPEEYIDAVILFVFINSLFATLAFEVGSALVQHFRSTNSGRWRP